MFSALQEVLSQWSTRKYCTRKEFQLLIAGRLHYVCMVAWPGRTCFCRMIDLLPCVLVQRWRSGWERSPPTNVFWVRFPVPALYLGRVCCWFSTLLREVFFRVLQFSLLPKKPTFSKFEFDPELYGHFWIYRRLLTRWKLHWLTILPKFIRESYYKYLK